MSGFPFRLLSICCAMSVLFAGIAFSLLVETVSAIETDIAVIVEENDDDIVRWSEKLDIFLDGTALAGLGGQFADSAVRYGTDIRLSAAIAMVESGADVRNSGISSTWGWAGYLGQDVKEGIANHAKILANDFEGTVSLNMARRYCPESPEQWLSAVESCMVDISAGRQPTLSNIDMSGGEWQDTPDEPPMEKPQNGGGLSDLQRKISNLGHNPPSSLKESTSSLDIICDLFASAGLKTTRCSCSGEHLARFPSNPDLNDVPVGACLLSTISASNDFCICGRQKGDACLNIGDGDVIFYGDKGPEIEPLADWVGEQYSHGGEVSWSWFGGHPLQTIGGYSGADDVAGPITAYHTKTKGTDVYWTLVSQGHEPKLAIGKGTPESLARKYKAAVATNFTTMGGGKYNGTTGQDSISGRNATGGDLFYLDAGGWWKKVSKGRLNMDKLGAKLGGIDNGNPDGWHVFAEDGAFLGKKFTSTVEGSGVRHPRTWMGQTTGGEFFSCVCDGMRPADTGCSEPGMSLKEMYDFTVKYICNGDTSQLKIAYNTDGGTSSAFVVNGELKNQCFAKGTRNAILFYTADSCEYKEWQDNE